MFCAPSLYIYIYIYIYTLLLKQGNSSLSKGCNVGNKGKHAFFLTPKYNTMKTIRGTRWYRSQSTV